MLNILIIILLIFITAFFSIIELALLAAKKTRLLALADEGNYKAEIAYKLSKTPNKVITTSQIGLTLVAIIEGAVTERALKPIFYPLLVKLDFLSAYATDISIIFSFLLVASLTILFGDLIPKRIALTYPEVITVRMLPVTLKVLKFFSPLIKIFSYLSDKILRLLGMPTESQLHVSAEDIEDLFEAGAQSGLLDQTEKGLLDNVWRMDERRVGALMCPRSEIIYIDINYPHKHNLEIIFNNPSKRIIVCNDGLDHILGVGDPAIWLREALQQLTAGNQNFTISWLDNLAQIHAIPNSLTLIETLEAFRKYKTHTALVYNEFGHVEGLITMSDLMSAVVGEYPETKDENLLILKDASGKWLIDGLAPIDDVKYALGIDELPDEYLGNYQTAAGFALSILGRSKGRLPKEFDYFSYGGYLFEVVDIDRTQGYRIDRLMVKLDDKPSVTEIAEINR